MRISRIVRQTPVKHGDEWALTVSTIQVGDRVIETSVDKAATREEAMENHREALYEVRTGTPKAPQ